MKDHVDYVETCGMPVLIEVVGGERWQKILGIFYTDWKRVGVHLAKYTKVIIKNHSQKDTNVILWI